MCGITGIYAFNEAGRFHLINLQKSTDRLNHRGPDSQGSYLHHRTGLGHRRLAVIDLSEEANQPMTDSTGRYWIIYNGEIYNFKLIRQELLNAGIQFRTQSDTEVLLYAFIHYGSECLQKLNGFFAFAIYDQESDEIFIARDRFGIKPLYYFLDDDKLIFASELKSILAFGIEKSLNFNALHIYLQLNYIPAPLSILNGVYKILPGHYLRSRGNKTEITRYYHLPAAEFRHNTPSSAYTSNIRNLLERSVERRMIADVTVGAFLSGGIDSTIITGLASRMKPDLKTFSIGYRDEPFFDETRYANLVAKKFNTQHTVFSLSNRDLFEHLYSILDQMDEPFADSSALPVYILSKETRKYATVALSGDGADELFGGYNKYNAFSRAMNPGLQEEITYLLRDVFKFLPQSRNGRFSNRIRQIIRFTEGFRLPPQDRYWRWASLNSDQGADRLLDENRAAGIDKTLISTYKNQWLQEIHNNIESVLKTDLQFILPNDMLYKVDMMSMAHGLEVRVPFLDHELVEYVLSVPAKYKISGNKGKLILKESFRDLLPPEIMRRPKKGFEVPLLRWFKTDLQSLINNDLLKIDFIKEQGIFKADEIENYKKSLFSRSPGDAHAHIWSLIVFQWWWKKYFI